MDYFTPSPEADSGNRSILIYSGIHYDAATLAPIKDAPEDFHQTIMPVRGSTPESDPILKAATALADKLRAKKAFTNTSTFTLKCEVGTYPFAFVLQSLILVVELRERFDWRERSSCARRRNGARELWGVLNSTRERGDRVFHQAARINQEEYPSLSSTWVCSFYGICSVHGV